MKIREILEDTATPPTMPATATPTTPTKKYQNIDTLKKDPEVLVNTWGPRITQLQARCNTMMARLISAAGPKYAGPLAGTTITVRSTEQYVAASADDRTIEIDITVFWDAPDATLAVAIGHELGHIALGHMGKATTAVQSRRDEFSADDFAIRLAKALGHNTAEVFRFMHDKQEYDYTNAISAMPNSTHPTYDQRIQRAKKAGFKLSKGDNNRSTPCNSIWLDRQVGVPHGELDFSPTANTHAVSAVNSIKLHAPVVRFTVSTTCVPESGLGAHHSGVSLNSSRSTANTVSLASQVTGLCKRRVSAVAVTHNTANIMIIISFM